MTKLVEGTVISYSPFHKCGYAYIGDGEELRFELADCRVIGGAAGNWCVTQTANPKRPDVGVSRVLMKILPEVSSVTSGVRSPSGK